MFIFFLNFLYLLIIIFIFHIYIFHIYIFIFYIYICKKSGQYSTLVPKLVELQNTMFGTQAMLHLFLLS